MNPSPDPHAAYDVLVLPMVINATTEDEARAELIQALIEDGSLIQVRPHAVDDFLVPGDDLGF